MSINEATCDLLSFQPCPRCCVEKLEIKNDSCHSALDLLHFVNHPSVSISLERSQVLQDPAPTAYVISCPLLPWYQGLNWAEEPGAITSQGLTQGSKGYTCLASIKGGRHLLGTRLMARSGRSTRTVRMAERLTLCPSREYSIMLGKGRLKEGARRRGYAPTWLAPQGPMNTDPPITHPSPVMFYTCRLSTHLPPTLLPTKHQAGHLGSLYSYVSDLCLLSL